MRGAHALPGPPKRGQTLKPGGSNDGVCAPNFSGLATGGKAPAVHSRCLSRHCPSPHPRPHPRIIRLAPATRTGDLATTRPPLPPSSTPPPPSSPLSPILPHSDSKAPALRTCVLGRRRGCGSCPPRLLPSARASSAGAAPALRGSCPPHVRPVLGRRRGCGSCPPRLMPSARIG